MATFLSLPAELRNQIYDLVFIEPSPYTSCSNLPSQQSSLADFGKPSTLDKTVAAKPQPLLVACRQIHHETQPLHFRRTSFVVNGPNADPECFSRLCNALSPQLLSDIRHITLVGRIPHLRALNESWNSMPFANNHLSLKTLVIIPRRPATHESHYAEVADLSSAHTLAYVLSETLKSLRGVERVIVRNEYQCFNKLVWRVLYRSMINRLLRWGGTLGCSRFRWDHEGGNWFEVLPDGRSADAEIWRDAAQEFQRLMD